MNISKEFYSKKIIIILMAVILLFPYKTTIVPEWTLKVLDQNDQARQGIRFRQNWDHYTYDISGVEFRKTDENGIVTFAERSFRLPLNYRILRAFFAYLMLIAHGGVGSSASVNTASDICSTEFLYYRQNKALTEQVVLTCK